ncbi:hypothetical protein ACSES4_13675 [Pseudomonas aeruginosa]
MITNNSKAPSCTCPSGDGSLRHPCPAHPAQVEQVGGDERAAFELFVRKHCGMPAHIAVNWDAKFTNDAWEGWKARAALAQPSGEVVVTKNESGAIVSVTRQDKEGRVLSVIAESATLTAQAEQAEAERPEVVAWQYRVTAGPQTGWSLWHPGKGEEFERSYTVERRPLMTVAQHERIVGELRAVIAQLRQHKNDYMDSGQETYRALQNEIREREAEIARLDGLVSGRTAERDAALARVKALEALVAARIKDVPVDAPVIAVVGDFNEEQVHECKRFHDAIRAQRNPKAIVVFLNSKNDIQAVDEAAMCAAGWVRAEAPVAQAEQAEAERPEGPTEDELEAAGLGYPLHKEEAVKLWYSGFRSEVITVLEAWEAIGHDIGMNPDKGELLDSLRYMLEKCEAHDAALAEVAGLRSLLNSLLCYVERDIDRMRSDRDKSDNKEIYDRSISLAMERLKAAQNAVFTTEPGCDTAVELAAQTTQAQHCVPEVSGIGRDFAYPRSVVLYLRTEPTDDDLRAIHDGLLSLAAAPGKEGNDD